MASPEEAKYLPGQERITVKQINQTALAAFLSRQTGKDFSSPGEDFSPHGYPSIFTSLREMAFSQQERLLVSFFTGGVEGFPNGKEFGEMLARINNIPWFRPKQEPEPGILEQLARTYLERLNYHSRPLPLKIIRENWAAAGIAMENWNPAPNATLDVAVIVRNAVQRNIWDAGRDANWLAAFGEAVTIARGLTWDLYRNMGDMAWRNKWDIAWEEFPGHVSLTGAAWSAGESTKWVSTWDARWTIVGDLMPARGYSKGNPFEPLMEIYRLGCWPIGPVATKKRKTETEFVVFIPLVVSSGNV